MHWKDKDLYYNKGFIFKVSEKVFLFFLSQVSFSWYCISREKKTTYIELDCCCFLIIRFFTKRLLSSFHKAISPLDLRIGMLVFQLPLGISKFFLILELTPVWRNYINSQHGCGPEQEVRSATSWSYTCLHLSDPVYKMRIQEKGVAAGLHLFSHAEFMGYAFLLFFF